MTDAEKIAAYREAFHLMFSLFVAYYNETAADEKPFCEVWCLCSDKCESHHPNVWICEPKILEAVTEVINS